jgi:hypothetical protein
VRRAHEPAHRVERVRAACQRAGLAAPTRRSRATPAGSVRPRGCRRCEPGTAPRCRRCRRRRAASSDRHPARMATVVVAAARRRLSTLQHRAAGAAGVRCLRACRLARVTPPSHPPAQAAAASTMIPRAAAAASTPRGPRVAAAALGARAGADGDSRLASSHRDAADLYTLLVLDATNARRQPMQQPCSKRSTKSRLLCGFPTCAVISNN